jgi:hypothetical protein
MWADRLRPDPCHLSIRRITQFITQNLNFKSHDIVPSLFEHTGDFLMNLNTITDVSLIANTESLIRQEREILTYVLHHLREIERRRLFSSLGYKSLFDFTVKRLGYPEDQAYRRISAMKLLKELPEIEEKISQGELSLTHIGLAHSLFKQEKKVLQKEMSHEQKLSVFNQISSKPVREAERITLSLSSALKVAKPDQVKSVSENLIEIKFTASADLREKIECLKGWLAHTNPNVSLGELFEKLCDLGLQEWDPSKTAAPRKRRVINRSLRNSCNVSSSNSCNVSSSNSCDVSIGSNCGVGKSIAVASGGSSTKSLAQIKREVFLKAHSKCENCSSSYSLEIDHIQPKSLGGDNSQRNLRLLCRSCNQRAAIQKLGQMQMDSFINPPRLYD